ncbi:acetolactate synthase 2 small subunit [Rheinheimera sp. MMS21-TC3]|uniref:acetolactate synthase 2 small subunit n=1 Tax=Rheinheimera sp. MMS21-TC3 TaxID=3072790 RepID=UPI0028C37D7E|nr:acetolactate synthase 2 small subunit [Rheinheimera sp. MMS21-TC3]WNO59513.1 acetolactate synthase 2 small subunit [Rheinheimera sp. MMS21-TC3]
MLHTLNITATNTPAVIERLLQVTRYRGYQLLGLEFNTQANSSGLEITLTVSSDKPIQLLTSQLNKLHDIKQLDLASANLAMLQA